tara:strand:- start:5278 stop:5748 length:471 start_codon:yes stop_codon:yes gene_type:complete
LDFFPSFFGLISSWLILAMILLTAIIVLLRYVFSQGVVAFQEVLIYCHGALFLLCAALALRENAHVRVDIFYRSMTEKTKRIIDLFGHLLFLQPVVWIIFLYSLDYVAFSWSISETSAEPGGLPIVYVYKSILLLFSILLILQSISIIIEKFTDND